MHFVVVFSVFCDKKHFFYKKGIHLVDPASSARRKCNSYKSELFLYTHSKLKEQLLG